MDIPEDVLQIVESVLANYDGDDTVSYSTMMASAIMADRRIRLEGAEDVIVKIRKVREGYADQARFADAEAAAYFREFVRRIDAAFPT